MSADHIGKSKHWLDRAAEMRTIAASMAEDGIKASMLRLANDYDKLAARAIARANVVGPKVTGIITGSEQSAGYDFDRLARRLGLARLENELS